MKKRRVLMLLENNPYFSDTRVQNEVETLSAHGYRVVVICPSDVEAPPVWRGEAVTVYSLPVIRPFSGKLGYLWEYGQYLVLAGIWALAISLRYGFDVIHLHNPPDILFLIALPWKLLGKRLVFDHHDLAPEILAFRFNKTEGLLYKAMVLAERASCRLADCILATNNSIKNLDIQRSETNPAKIYIVRNGPRLSHFAIGSVPDQVPTCESSWLAYVGTIGPMDGVNYLLYAIAHIRYEMGIDSIRCRIIGDGDSQPDMIALAQSLGIEDLVHFTGWVKSREALVRILCDVDVCVDPAPSNNLNDRLTMIKIMEYMALAKPIVAFDLPETKISAQGAALYARPNEPEDLARKIVHLIHDPRLRLEMGRLGRQRVVCELAWEYSSEALVAAYDCMCENRSKAQ